MPREKRSPLLTKHLKELGDRLLGHAHYVEEAEHPEGVKAEHRPQGPCQGALVRLEYVVLHQAHTHWWQK